MDYIERVSLKFVWTNSVGLARSIIALSTLVTLIFNPFDQLFKEGIPSCDTLQISLFCLLRYSPILLKSLCIFILSLVILGWRPRITGVLHWWIAYSFANSGGSVDGGDHIGLILTTLLIPICLTDPRKWHWQFFDDIEEEKFSYSFSSSSIIAQVTLFVIKLQVSFIYLHAAVAKVSVKEWMDGTALYYWFSHPVFGANDFLKPILMAFVKNEYISTYLTYVILILEFSLFAGIFMNTKLRKTFLILGILFHFGIFMIHGLFTFFLVMVGALILYFNPESSFRLLKLSQNMSRLIHIK